MASTYPFVETSSLPFPVELVEAVAAEAEADADRVAEFLHNLGLLSTEQPRVCLSADLLLFLRAVLRLNSWEESGLQIHLAAGLPSASKALADAIRSVGQQGKPVSPRDFRRRSRPCSSSDSPGAAAVIWTRSLHSISSTRKPHWMRWQSFFGVGDT